MIEIHAEIMGERLNAYINPHYYEIGLTAWSGRQSSIDQLNGLISFLSLARDMYQALQNNPVETLAREMNQAFQVPPHDQAPNADEHQAARSSLTVQAVDEILADEALPFPSLDAYAARVMDRSLDWGHGGVDDAWLVDVPDTEEDIKERAILADMKKEEDAAWYEAAPEQELANQGGGSDAYLDDSSDDDEWYDDYGFEHGDDYGFDDDEEDEDDYPSEEEIETEAAEFRAQDDSLSADDETPIDPILPF